MSGMNVEQLKQTVMECLEKRGVMGQLKAQLRNEIYSVVSENTPPKNKSNDTKEEQLLKALIFQTLNQWGYKFSKSVFKAESQMNEEEIENHISEFEKSDFNKPSLVNILEQYIKQGKADNYSNYSQSFGDNESRNESQLSNGNQARSMADDESNKEFDIIEEEFEGNSEKESVSTMQSEN